MDYQLITEQDRLDDFVKNIAGAKIIALDTEFMRRRTLYPEVALLQVFDGQHLALIDPLAELNMSMLWDKLADKSVLKVLHSPSEDIEVFMNYAGFVPTPLFDTQFALQLLGSTNSMGFANMVKALLEIDIDKSESRTNWLQRPLRDSQLDYAAADVAYLMPCFEQIIAQIDEKGWRDIVLEESELTIKKRAFSLCDELLYQEAKGAWQLNPKALAVLQELAPWRREKAQRKNLALNFILKEANMIEIAKQMPTSLNGLRRISGVEAMEVNRSGKEILACIERALAVSEQDYPDKVLRLMDYPKYKQTAKVIKHKINASAKEHGLPSDVIASKKQINQLISWHWKYNEHERSARLAPDLLQAWRLDIVKDELVEWLNVN